MGSSCIYCDCICIDIAVGGYRCSLDALHYPLWFRCKTDARPNDVPLNDPNQQNIISFAKHQDGSQTIQAFDAPLTQENLAHSQINGQLLETNEHIPNVILLLQHHTDSCLYSDGALD